MPSRKASEGDSHTDLLNAETGGTPPPVYREQNRY